jgi:hypothetical protein
VVWYPVGDPDDLGYPDEPFVYVVLGPPRRYDITPAERSPIIAYIDRD